jgi:N-acetylglutamate synthase-like GNAT family acetyltransferase
MSDVLKFAGASEAARALFWDVFFSSRGRGVSLQAHFPWLEDTSEVTCLEIRDPANFERSIAALIIRTIRLPSTESVGLIGLVCVESTWRGRGLSVELMSNAIDHAKHVGLPALVLWTLNPGIYEQHGFCIDDQDLTGNISRPQARAVSIEYVRDIWPGSANHDHKRGLPPFASSGQRLKSDRAELILVGSESRVTLAEWSGTDSDVVDLIETVILEPWILNIRAHDALIAELTKREFKVDVVPGALRMIKRLSDNFLALPPIKLIDRI